MKKLILGILLAMMILPAAAVFAQSRKGVSILGDSYSTFEGCVYPDSNAVWYWKKSNSATDVRRADQTWWHKLITDNGYRLCKNNSFSGSTVCNTGYRGNDYSTWSFIARMKDLGEPDIIYIFGGTNDSWAKVPVGEFKYSDWTKEDLYSYRPGLAYLLSSMKEYYPGVEIVFLINNGLSDDVTLSTQAICDHYGIDYIQLVDIDRIEGHPSVKGMQQIVDQINAHSSR